MKARKILAWTAGVLFALYAIIYVARFQRTLPIEGVVVDARTGKPVSKVLVHANWHFSYPNLVDTTGGGFGHGTVTGEDGKFRIPRRNVTAVFGSFIDQYLIVQHPLYDVPLRQVYVQMYKQHRLGVVRNGVLQVTLPIESLEEKYSKREDISTLARKIDNCGPQFFQSMKENFGVRYDLDKIMSELERLSLRFPDMRPEDNPAYLSFKTHEYLMKEFRKSY